MADNKRPETEPEIRRLRAHEAMCKYGCRSIVDTRDGDGAQGHCGMCCDKARATRAKRVAPIHAAEVEANEIATAAQLARIAAKQEVARVAALPPTTVVLPEQPHNKHRR